MGVVGGTRRPTFRPTPCLVVIMVSVFDIVRADRPNNKNTGSRTNQGSIKTGSRRTDKKTGGHLHGLTDEHGAKQTKHGRTRTRTDAGIHQNREHGRTNTDHEHRQTETRTAEHPNRCTETTPTKAGTESGESPPPTRYYNTIESGVKYGSKSSGATICKDSV